MPERGPAGPVTLSQALNCTGCGAGLEIRAGGHSLTIVCGHCGAVLDAKDPNFQIVARFDAKTQIKPKIPLGTRGKLDGIAFEVIGFQVRTITVEGVNYSWHEYLLFNPYQGFRYITEYNGHWNKVRTVRAAPQDTTSGGKPAAKLGDRTFKHFQTARAKTTYVIGEFPWQVRGGDTVDARDYVAPPFILSAEAGGGEVTWSLGEYTAGAEIWKAFKLKGGPPSAEGIFANQPSPYTGKVGSIWGAWAMLMAALLGVMIFFAVFTAGERVFSKQYRFIRGQGEPSYVTGIFELKGRVSDVMIEVRTNLNNNWAYFSYALISEDTGQAFDFGREVSYYRDSEGSEGSPNDEAVVPSVVAGRYYLRVEPEMPEGGGVMEYTLIVRRDVPVSGFYWIAAVFLTIPPIIMLWRSMYFEGKRWQESDYATSSDD